MHFSLSTATALALSSIVSATPTYEYGTPKPKPVGLHSAIVAKGRTFFGAALTIRDDAKERAILDNSYDFGSVTPENAFKWESTEPTRNNFTFAGADAVVKYAKSAKKQIHCHTLVWHSQLPAWVSSDGFDNKTLIAIMTNHIKKVAGKYKDVCTRWDVANEVLNEDGTYRESVFYKTIGEAYIPIAFRLAHKYAPKAKLYLNDYNLEYAEAKTVATAKVVKLIQSYGVKIHGVGLQGHLVSESTPTQANPTPSQKVLEKALRMFTKLGVDVAYTEVDIRLNTPTTPQKLKIQADAYARVTKSCLAVKRCVGITLWGITDKYSWIPGVFAGEGGALVWDEQYKKKPAYAAILKAIQKS